MSDSDELLKDESAKIKTIFIVEDDVAVGEFFALAIEQETPYHVLLAVDGVEALRLVGSLKPDLFVLDYLLPRMNGIALYDHLHAIEGFEDIPALFVSANLPTGELGARRVYHLKKPVELEDLLRTIEQLLA